MPSKSPAQHRLMLAVAHDPKFARRVGISQSVGRDFAAADKNKYADGGSVRNPMGPGRTQIRPEDVEAALEARKASQERSPTFLDALGALSDTVTGGAHGAAKVALGWPGDIEKLAVDLTGVDKKNNLYSLAAGDAPTQTLFPTSEDVGKWLPPATQFSIPRDKNPFIELGSYAPLSPGQLAKLAKPALAAAKPVASGLGRLAAEAARRGVEEGRGPLAGLAAVSRTHAVRPRGGNFNADTSARYLDELRGWESEDAADPVSSWLNKTLGNYLKKDIGSPADPLLQVEKEHPNLHLPENAMEDARFMAERVNRMPTELMPSWLSPQMTGQTAYYAKLAKAHRDLTNEPLTAWGELSGSQVKGEPILSHIAGRYDMHGWEAPEYLKKAADDGLVNAKSFTPEEQAAAVLKGEKDIPNYSRWAERGEEDTIRRNYGWALKDPEAKMWSLRSNPQEEDHLGFGHVRDYLNAAVEPYRQMQPDALPRLLALNEGALRGLPFAARDVERWRGLHNAGLTLTPEQLARTSVADAVRKTAQWNEHLASKQGEAVPGLSQGIVGVHKEYPEDGLKWVKLGSPNLTELPEGVKLHEHAHFGNNSKIRGYHVGEPTDLASSGEIFGSSEEAIGDYLKKYNRNQLEAGLNAEGDAMGHCVGRYCNDVASRGTQIYSLRDAKNNPHVTIEVRPKNTRNQDLLDLGGPPEGRYDSFNRVFGEDGRRIAEAYQATKMPGHPWFDRPEARTPQAFEAWLREAYPQRIPEYEVAQDKLRKALEKNANTLSILQIKGKSNAAPVSKYLPHVQDFVKSGQWEKVNELGNAGLVRVDPAGDLAVSLRLQKKPVPAYVTQDELTQLLSDYRGALPGYYAAGGSVQAYTPPTVRQFLLDRLEG